MYDFGRGVAQSDADAMTWYRRAADQGHATAQNNLGAMYADGQGVGQDYVEAMMWFILASKSGDPDAPQSIDMARRLMTPSQMDEAQRRAQAWRPQRGG